MTDQSRQMDAYLQARLDDYIAETARLCAQPSVSATGEGIAECAEMVIETLARRGFEVQKLATPGNPVIVGRIAGRSERTLLFYNHYDVQPPEPLELWTTPPFEPTVRDGALYARGAGDDKGELVARLAAFDAVRQAHGGELPCGATFIIEGEEEIGSPHIAQFVQDHKELLACHGSVWEFGGVDPDGRPDLTLGYRGIATAELTVRTMSRDGHSGSAHKLPSAAWRLLRVLATLKGEDERIQIDGFYDQVRPPSPRDLELLDTLPDTSDWLRKELDITEFPAGRTGRALDRAVFEPTCNIQGITTGYQGRGMKTVVPAEASAKLDFRLVPDQDPDEILALLRAHLDRLGFADVRLSALGKMWPAKVSPDDPFVALIVSTAEEVYGQPSVIDPLAGGSSPAYAFMEPLGGIPVVTAGVNYPGGRAHAPDEHIRLDNFLKGARHLARILDGFAGLA